MATKTTKKKTSTVKKKTTPKNKLSKVEKVDSISPINELSDDSFNCCLQQEQEKSDSSKTLLQKIRDWFLG